jgi:hypothetical protein
VFPTTVWTVIRKAGANDPQAMEGFARDYRLPVLRYIERRGFSLNDADDLCQEVFLRILSSQVLARVDQELGRFRSLVLAVTRHVLQNAQRGSSREPRREPDLPDLESGDSDPEFDAAWILHLADRAMTRLGDSDSPYYEVLRGHLSGAPQDRNKLWIARKKLIALIRDEVARTCSSPEELEEELAYLSPFLRPATRESSQIP